MTVTGSTNATQKSLCTTDNIEVSVLGSNRNEQSGQFRKTVPLPKAHQNWSSVKLALETESWFMRIVKHGDLAGSLIASRNVQGAWQAAVVRPDGEMVEFNLMLARTAHSKPQFPTRRALRDPDGITGGLQARWCRGTRVDSE